MGLIPRVILFGQVPTSPELKKCKGYNIRFEAIDKGDLKRISKS